MKTIIAAAILMAASTAHAVKMGRRFIGSELKPQYWELACQNIEDARVSQRGCSDEPRRMASSFL